MNQMKRKHPLTLTLVLVFLTVGALGVKLRTAKVSARQNDASTRVEEKDTFSKIAKASSLLHTPIGRDQRVAVIVCKYAGSADPSKSAQDWAADLNLNVTPYYDQATRGMDGQGLTTFQFFAVPGVCEFDYTYQDTAPGGSASPIPAGGLLGIFDIESDPIVIIREIPDAIEYALGQQPGIFDDDHRLLVIVNEKKRARSTIGESPFFIQDETLFLSAALLTETNDLSTFAHELGHQLGLPDLYRYQEIDPGPRYVESWGQMASDNFQNFTTFSRRASGWLNPAFQEQVISPPILSPIEQDVILHASNSTDGAGVELIRIPLDPTGVDNYFIESRPRIGLDSNLPSSYDEGVLITKVRLAADPGIQFIPGVSGPVVVQPRQPSTGGRELAQAAFRVGDVFTDSERGLSISVIADEPLAPPANSALMTGTHRIHIEWETPPRPDVVALDAWLDNPTNGFFDPTDPNPQRFYWTPIIDQADGVPLAFGDPAVTFWRTVLDYSTFPPTPTLQQAPLAHFVRLRAANVGNATADSVQGTVLVLKSEIPASFNLADPAAWLSLTIDTIPVFFGTIPAGETAVRFVPVFPEGPFAVALFLDEIDNEWTTLNNFYHEPFLVTQVAPGSPYEPVDLELPVQNLNANAHAVVVNFPEPDKGWDVTLNQTLAPLAAADSSLFKLHAQPPDPSVEKPGQLKPLELTAWMDYGDAWIPVIKFPTYVVLSNRTTLTLKAQGEPEKFSLSGQLTWRNNDGIDEPLADARVFIKINGTDGSEEQREVTTDSVGSYEISFPLDSNVQYGAVAAYFGEVQYKGSRSDAVVFGKLELEPQVLVLESARDSTISEFQPKVNFGSEALLSLGRGTQPRSEAADFSALLQFDVSALPQAAAIITAQLELQQVQAQGALDFEVIARVIQESWSERSVTWLNQPADTGAADRPATLDSKSGPKRIDLTRTVQGWFLGGLANHGVRLVGDGRTLGARAFASREDETQGPKLIIEYILLPERKYDHHSYLPLAQR
jgi:hypothetical protein